MKRLASRLTAVTNMFCSEVSTAQQWIHLRACVVLHSDHSKLRDVLASFRYVTFSMHIYNYVYIYVVKVIYVEKKKHLII